jgi:hypothetical protein
MSFPVFLENTLILCSTKTPSEKHIKTLAAHEGISIDEFKNKYSFRGD